MVYGGREVFQSSDEWFVADAVLLIRLFHKGAMKQNQHAAHTSAFIH